MKIQIEPFEDKSDADENGMHEYFYSGRMFFCTEGAFTVKARSYDDSPEEISFLTINDQLFSPSTATLPVLLHIMNELKKMGFKKFLILYGEQGYSQFPLS